MARQLVLVRHGDDPPDDRVVTFAVENGFEPVILRPFRGDPLPAPGPEVAGTVIYGGPFNAYDHATHPFLKAEEDWIRACMDRGLPVLGICQGAQQIAHLLGARVGPIQGEPHEFGYYRVDPTPEGADFLPGPLHMCQAHFHMFDIPPGATRLAGSDLFPNQAFRFGARVYGLQFHPEVTIEGFRRWQNAPWAAWGRPGAQTRGEQTALMHAHDAAQADWFMGFLSRLFGRAG